VKRLLIHVGYPKAASTTLQNALFLGLHERGFIHFLGRAFESDFCGFASDKQEFKKWLSTVSPNERKPHRYDALDPDRLPDIFAQVSSQKVNLLSEGALILNDRVGESFAVPRRIYDYFHKNVDRLEIILVIRSQITLIMSNYVQRYRNIEEKKFIKYLNVHMNGKKKNSGDFKIYNIYNVLKSYVEVFGRENIHILFFEDMMNDNTHFVNRFSKILNVNPLEVDHCLSKGSFNVTKKESDYHVCKKPFKRSFRYRFGKFLRKFHVEPGELMETKVPKMSRDEEQRIFEYFRDSNIHLATEFSLNTEKMQTYRYF